jgi:hypothetical protein
VTLRAIPPARVVVLPSPLLGPAAYQPLASSLATQGVAATVAPLPSSTLTPARVVDAFTTATREHAATHLVAHSNAGYYAPTLAAFLDLPVAYLDAALPAAGVTETLLAPAAFAGFIDSLPRHDGLLPPWPAWWDRSDVAALFPSDEWLDRVTREAPRLSPDYFTTPIPVPVDWESRPAAYLAFGSTYADEVTFAQRAGWVVRQEEGHHLQHLAEPDHVAELVLDLIQRLVTPR